ncbi:MAG TPA: DNA/RNA non-specific endonuclease, partial [Vicinamibacterales bacterium]|nr:DNA/RNA non-specific endonuclease [Vicinamibacterales bacterium]
ETSVPINQATFLMTNMVAQAPDNNQGPWAALEGYLRTLLPSSEIYIVAGGAGAGGTGSNGGVTMTLANGHVAVPAYTWKVALVIPKGFSDIARVSCSSRTIAVIMPNTQGIRTDLWENYLTTVDAVEALTGYNLFSELPLAIQQCLEAGVNGTNPPLDDTPPVITITAPSALTYIVGQTVIANYTCVDAASAIVTCAGPVASGQPIATSAPGAGVFTVMASDTAGNTASQTVSYSVGYSICALYDQTKAHKAGSTVPIKLQVCNFTGTSVSSPGISVVATGVMLLANNAPGVLEDSGNANPDNQFRFVPDGGGSYIFNLSTKNLAQGTYALVFTVGGDATPHTVQFQVR